MIKPFNIFFAMLCFAELLPAQWILQPSPTTNHLYDIKFYDGRKGIIVGENIILNSNDSGKTWSLKDFQYEGFRSCWFQNKDSIWAVGWNSAYSNLIANTTDGGINWNIIDTNDAYSASIRVFFYDKLHGWIGEGNVITDTVGWIRRTTDGGKTWEKIFSGFSTIFDVFFLDTLNGWAVSKYGSVYRSTDGGVTWNINSRIGYLLERVIFITPDSGWICGGIAGNEVIARTTNGGNSWEVKITNGSSLHGMYFSDSRNGWIVGGQNAGLKILRTVDGGENWSSQYLPLSPYATDYFENVYMFDSNTGFVVGGDGIILKTTNGGLTAINDESSLFVKEPLLYQNYPNPFNPVTKIKYDVPKADHITLKIFDIIGREISTLADEDKPAGKYEIVFDGEDLPSGIYFYKLQCGNFIQSKKLILLK